MIANEERALTTAELVQEQNSGEARPVALFSRDEGDELRRRWTDVQTRFVDDPSGSVKSADELVAATIKRLTEMFADERQRLEKDWEKNEQVSTEDLRMAFRRYRSFFDRLLSI
jgi:hypothetical protein